MASRRDIQLPYHLETMTTGTLPPEPLPKRSPDEEVKKAEKGKYSDSLVSSQQMLLENIRRLKSEVEKTNRDIIKSRNDRLYSDIMKDEINQERELPFSSRFYKPKIQVVEKTTIKTEIVETN